MMEGNVGKSKSMEDLEESFGRGEIEADEFQHAKRGIKRQELRGKLSRGEISREEFLREQLRAGLEKLVVHGDYFFKEDGSVELQLRADLDAMAGIYLMDLAGINYSAVEFQHKGKWVPGAIHIDTGERREFTVEDDGSIFFDHHGKEKGEFTSAAQITYEKLVELGFLKKEEWLDRFAAFITEVDNLSYPIDEKFFRGSWSNTLYGVQKVLPVSTIADFFKKGRDPRRPFTMEEATSIIVKTREGEKTLLDLCNNTSQKVLMSLANIDKAIEKMKRRGIKQETSGLGKVIFQDVEKGRKNKIPMGFTAVKALGHDTYVIWNENSKSFFMSSQSKDMAEIYEKIRMEIPTAKLIRGTMILSPPTADAKDLTAEKLLSVLELKKYTESAAAAATKPTMTEQEAGIEKEVETKNPFSAYIKDVLEVRFGEGALSPEEFTKKRDALKRIAQEKEGKRREALDEAFGEEALTREEYLELKVLLKEVSRLQRKGKRIKKTAAEPDTTEGPTSREAAPEGGEPKKQTGDLQKGLRGMGERWAERYGIEPETTEEEEGLAKELARARKELRRLEGLGIKTSSEDAKIEELKAKEQELADKIRKVESARAEENEMALLRDRIEEQVETIKNLFSDLPEEAREEVAEEAREALEELAPEVIRESDPKILVPKIIGVLFDRIAELPEEALPGLRGFKEKDPEGFSRLKEELVEAFRETDKTKRKEKFDAVWKKYELAEEAEKLAVSTKDLLETTSEIWHLVRTKELSPQEQAEAEAALKKAKEGQAALAEGFKKIGRGLGFAGQMFFLIFFWSFLLALSAAEHFLKKRKKK